MSSTRAVIEVRQNLPRLVKPDGRAPIGLVERLVMDSTWWLTHLWGGSVHAPKHYERIQDGGGGYELEFGANRFLAEAAVLSCARVILDATGEVERTGKLLSRGMLEQKLLICMVQSVANYRGDRFTNYPIRLDGYLEFGASGICVSAFLSGIWERTKLDLITETVSRGKPKGTKPFLDSLYELSGLKQSESVEAR